MSLRRFMAPFFAVVVSVAASSAAETLSYDGTLLESGAPANGIFDLRFRCFSGPESELHDQIGPVIEKDDVRVVHGRFAVELDFGSDDRCAAAGWLETAVARGDRIGGFTVLHPLQAVGNSQSRETADSIPLGTIAFFNLDECPPGWSEYVPARGRAIVGLAQSGTLGGTYGAPLSNLEDRTHQHHYSNSSATSSSGSHNHIWSSIQSAGGSIQWSSYTAGGNPVLAFSWTNGIGNEGSGIYPMAAQPNDTFYTSVGGVHNHLFTVGPDDTSASSCGLPYIQLLVCRKD
jgi:hypothetical protein